MTQQARGGQVEDLTVREQSWRDRVLYRVVDRLPANLKPDHLTRLRIALVVVAVLLYFRRASLVWQVAILLAAALTDLIDGPLARRRGLTTAHGARLDHHADSLLTGWLGLLSVLEASPPPVLLACLAAGQAVVLGSDPAWRAAWTSRHGAPREAPRPTLLARLQLALVVLGFWCLLVHAVLGWRTRRLGEWLLAAGLGATGARLVVNLQGHAPRQSRAA